MNNDPASFDIKMFGDITGEQWVGLFKAKKRLSYRDQLRRDQVRRDLLGNHPEAASALALSQAEIFSELSVRLIQAPSWWTEKGNGIDLEDDNVVIEVYQQAMKAESDALKELKEKGEAAKVKLAEEIKKV